MRMWYRTGRSFRSLANHDSETGKSLRTSGSKSARDCLPARIPSKARSEAPPASTFQSDHAGSGSAARLFWEIPVADCGCEIVDLDAQMLAPGSCYFAVEESAQYWYGRTFSSFPFLYGIVIPRASLIPRRLKAVLKIPFLYRTRHIHAMHFTSYLCCMDTQHIS
jgi:hypothetical protein